MRTSKAESTRNNVKFKIQLEFYFLFFIIKSMTVPKASGSMMFGALQTHAGNITPLYGFRSRPTTSCLKTHTENCSRQL